MPAKCTYCPIFDFFECQVDSAFYQTSAGTKWSRWFSRWADVADELSDNNLISSERNDHTILTWNMTSSCLLSTGNQAPPAVAAVRLLFLHLCLPHAGEISQAGCEIYCFKFILFFLPKIANPMLARYRKQDVRFVVFNSISWLTQKSIICFQLQMSLRMRQSHPNLKTLFSNCGTMRHGAQGSNIGLQGAPQGPWVTATYRTSSGSNMGTRGGALLIKHTGSVQRVFTVPRGPL